MAGTVFAEDAPVDIARKSPRKIGKLPVGVIIAVAVACIVAATVWRSSAAAAPSVARSAVWTERVRRGDLLRQVPAQGTLVPEHVEWLSAVTAARVAKIMVRPGAAVEPDTVVVVLENAELELAALVAEQQAANAQSLFIQLDVRTEAEQKLQEANLVGLRADLRDAERHADSANRLAPEGLMNEIEHADAQNKATSLTERVESEEARHHVLMGGRGRQLIAQQAEVDRLRDIAKFRREQLAALEVRAGIHGVVQDVPLENGQWVAIGTMLAKVAEPTHLKADLRVAEGYARDVHKGLGVRFESPAGNYRGQVERVDPAVVGGNVRLEVRLDAALPGGLRVDQAANGFVEIETLPDVLHVARPAAATDGATMALFRVEPDGVHASRVTARLGRGSTREIEVTGGLADGDEVVVSDTSSWDGTSRIRLK